MPYSHHSHSGEFCLHGSGTLSSMIEEAIKQAFKMYALTEHCPRWREQDLYPEEIEAKVTPKQLQATFETFLTEAHRLRETHSSTSTEILIGLETEHIYEEDIGKLQSIIEVHRNRIDFIVGSVHHSDGLPIDFSKEKFTEALDWYKQIILQRSREKEREVDSKEGGSEGNLDQAALSALLEAYFQAQMRLMKALHPEVIGHLALPLLFTYDPATGPAKLVSHPKAVALARENIRYAISYGALFELSSAPFRKGWGEGWPGTEVVQMIVEEGGLFCLSDDAHDPTQVGLNYPKLRSWAEENGVTGKMIRRLKRKEGGGVEHVPCEDVWADAFWQNRS